MPIQYPNFPMLSDAQVGQPNYAERIYQGIQTGFAPRTMAQDLLTKQMEARNLKSQIGARGAELSLLPYRKQLLEAQAQQANAAGLHNRMLGDVYSKILERISQGQGAGQEGNIGSIGGQNTGVPIFGQPIPQQSTESYIPPVMESGSLPRYQQQLQNNMGLNPNIPGAQFNQQPANYPQQLMNAPFPSQQNQMPQNTGINEDDLLAAMMHIPVSSQVVNGQLVKYNPLSGYSFTKIGPTEAEKEYTKGDVKLTNEMTSTLPAAYELQAHYSTLNNLMQSEQWREMQNNFAAQYGMHWGRDASLQYYKERGTPEQKEMIGAVEALSNKIIAQSSKVFKGPFRVGEQKLLESMKPTANDPVDVALGKIGALMDLADLQLQMNSIVPQLMRNQGMPPQQAFNTFMHMSKGGQFVDGLRQKYSKSSEVSKKNEDTSKPQIIKKDGKTYKFIKGKWYEQ